MAQQICPKHGSAYPEDGACPGCEQEKQAPEEEPKEEQQ